MVALPSHATELTPRLVQLSEHLDRGAIGHCVTRASRVVKAIAAIISVPMVDEK